MNNGLEGVSPEQNPYGVGGVVSPKGHWVTYGSVVGCYNLGLVTGI